MTSSSSSSSRDRSDSSFSVISLRARLLIDEETISTSDSYTHHHPHTDSHYSINSIHSTNTTISNRWKFTNWFITKKSRFSLCIRCKGKNTNGSNNNNGIFISNWLYLLIIILLILLSLFIIIIILMYTLVPYLIQKSLESGTIELYSIDIELLSPDYNTLFIYSSASVNHFGSIAALISAGEGRILSKNIYSSSSTTNNNNNENEWNPIISFELPEIHWSGDGNSQSISIISPAPIINEFQFQMACKQLLFESQFQWQLESSLTVTPILFGIKLNSCDHLKFNKLIPLMGLNHLSNSAIKTLDLTNSTSNSIEIEILLEFHNPSIFSVSELGKLKFHDYYNGDELGVIKSHKSLQLIRGINEYRFYGQLNYNYNNSDSISLLLENYFSNQSQMISAIADYNCSSIILFNPSFNGLSIKTLLKGYEKSLIQRLLFNSLNIIPSNLDHQILLNGELEFIIESPIGNNSPLLINSVELNTNSLFPINSANSDDNSDSMIEYLLIWNLIIQNTSVIPININNNNNNNNNGKAQLHYKLIFTTSIAHLLNNSYGYSQFLNEFIKKSEEIKFHIQGNSIVSLNYLYGQIILNNLPISIDTSLLGLNNFQGSRAGIITILNERICNHPSGICGVNIGLQAELYNPSIVSIQFPYELQLSIIHKQYYMGSLILNSLNINTGNNIFQFNGYLNPIEDPNNPIESMRLFELISSDYLNNIDIMVYVNGSLLNKKSIQNNNNNNNNNNMNNNIIIDSSPSAAEITLNHVGLNVNCIGQSNTNHLLSQFQLNELIIDFGVYSPTNLELLFNPLNDHHIYNETIGFPIQGKLNLFFELPTNLNKLTYIIESSDIQYNGIYHTIPYILYSTNQSQIQTISTNPPTHLLIDIQREFIKILSIPILESLIDSLLYDYSSEFQLSGRVSPIISTHAFGLFHLYQLYITENSLLVNGFNGFKSHNPIENSLISVLKFDVINSYSSNIIEFNGIISIENIGNLQIHHIGTLTVDIEILGIRIGYISLMNVSFELGVNQYNGMGKLIANPNSLPMCQAFQFLLSNILNRVNTPITIYGGLIRNNGNNNNNNNIDNEIVSGTSVSILKSSIAKLKLNSILPGINQPFISGFGVDISLSIITKILFGSGTNRILPAELDILNPFSTDVIVVQANINIFNKDLQSESIGYWNSTMNPNDPLNPPIIIKPNQLTITRFINIIVTHVTATVVGKLIEILLAPPAYFTAEGIIKGYVTSYDGSLQSVDLKAVHIATRIAKKSSLLLSSSSSQNRELLSNNNNHNNHNNHNIDHDEYEKILDLLYEHQKLLIKQEAEEAETMKMNQLI